MTSLSEPSRRTVLTAAVATAAAAAGGSAGRAVADTTSGRGEVPAHLAQAPERPAEYHAWTSYTDWRAGGAEGTRAKAGERPGLVIDVPLGTTDYTDPHTGRTAAWEYATWTSPVHRVTVPATEVIASWNARTPAGTWIGSS